jgi:hypothetical protein
VSSITPEPNNWAVSIQQTPFEQHQQMMIQQQLIQQNNVENELTQLRQQAACAQQLVSGYEGRINELSGQLRDYERRIGEYV